MRLVERFALGDVVEICFSADSEWRIGRIIAHAHPAVWVELPNGRQYFVTNTARIRHFQRGIDDDQNN